MWRSLYRFWSILVLAKCEGSQNKKLKMHFSKLLLVSVCLFPNLVFCQYGADLQSCSVESNQGKICIIANESYQKPFPVSLGTELYLKEIVYIDEDWNSISIQLDLTSFWNDTGLTHSNNTIM